ncbi:hypothetical protein AB0K48_30395 [Nonomuraea sp. NPDC055795]
MTETSHAPAASGALPVIGHMWTMWRDPMTLLLAEHRAQRGVVALRFGPKTVYLLPHPHLVRRMLLNDDHTFDKAGRSSKRPGP